jgi:hypothetical protein
MKIVQILIKKKVLPVNSEVHVLVYLKNIESLEYYYHCVYKQYGLACL